MFLHPSQ